MQPGSEDPAQGRRTDTAAWRMFTAWMRHEDRWQMVLAILALVLSLIVALK
jgi:hypothetical protein